MIRFHELVFGYENVARLQMEKGNYLNAKEQLRKALRTVRKEKFTEEEKKEVLVTLDKIFEDYIKMEEPSSCLETIEAIIYISNGKVDLTKYGRAFLDKFSSAADFYKYESKLKELIPGVNEIRSSSNSNTSSGNQAEMTQNISMKSSKEEVLENNSKLANALADNSDPYSNKFAKAKEEYNKGNKDEAVRILKELLLEKPDYKDALTMLQSLTDQNREKMKEIEEKIKIINSGDNDIDEILKYIFLNELEKANDIVTKEISKRRENPRLWFLKSYIVGKMGNEKLAKNFEAYAEKLNPNFKNDILYKELNKN